MAIYGDGEMSAEQETLGMCARRLRAVSWLASEPRVRDASQAGQGAHREVGSEGFAANHRAVAEPGEPVGQVQARPSRRYDGEGNTWSAWTHQGECGRHGGTGTGVTPGGLVRSRPTGREPGRISRWAKSMGMPCEKSE